MKKWLHFNKSIKGRDWNEATNNASYEIYNDNSLIAIDTIRVDDHSRITLTRKTKSAFPIESGEVIAVYQDIQTNNLVLKVQHSDHKVDAWSLKRVDIDNSLPIRNASSSATTITPSVNDDTINAELHKRTSFNIMVIDDEPDILLSIKAILSPEGYNVETFQNSTQALNRFTDANRRPYFDVVLTDIRMPAPNGIQLYRMLKNIDPNIKVIFISALDAATELISIFPGMESNVVKKPFEQEDLITAVKNIGEHPSK